MRRNFDKLKKEGREYISSHGSADLFLNEMRELMADYDKLSEKSGSISALCAIIKDAYYAGVASGARAERNDAKRRAAG